MRRAAALPADMPPSGGQAASAGRSAASGGPRAAPAVHHRRSCLPGRGVPGPGHQRRNL